jgi:hypothetical protein
MVDTWPFKPFTFRAATKTFGQMWLRCDLCQRYARLKLTGLLEVDFPALCPAFVPSNRSDGVSGSREKLRRWAA